MGSTLGPDWLMPFLVIMKKFGLRNIFLNLNPLH